MTRTTDASWARDDIRTHMVLATPETVQWGAFDASVAPVRSVRSGDTVMLECLAHHAGDAPELMMDEGVRAVHEFIPKEERGPGVHIITGPIHAGGAQPGDTLECRVLTLEPRVLRVQLPSQLGTAPRRVRRARARRLLRGRCRRQRRPRRLPLRVPARAAALHRLHHRTGLRRAAFRAARCDHPAPPSPGDGGRRARPGRQGQHDPAGRPRRQHGQPRVRGRDGDVLPGRARGRAVLGRRQPFRPERRRGQRRRHRGTRQCDLQLILHKDMPLNTPLLETPDLWLCHGFDEDLDEAVRQAVLETIGFLTERWAITREEAYSVVGLAADLRVTQVVDGVKGAHMAIRKDCFREAPKTRR